MDVLHELVRTVSRTFYDEKAIMFLDYLLHYRIMSDEELADRLCIVLKDVNRTAAKLREDKLLKSEVRQEVRPSDQKLLNRTYYYIDFKMFVDVLKYRMYMMKKSIEDQMKNEMENKGYKCPKCNKNYSPLELQSLMNPQSMLFECEICNSEIEEHTEDPAKVQATQATLSQLMDQTAPLLRVLKKTDSITIPHFDPMEHLRQKQAFEAMSKANEGGQDEMRGIDNPSSTSVNIHIQIEETDNAPKVHTLPSWYTHSTVTGEQIVVSDSKEASVTITTTESLTNTESESIQQYYENLQSLSSLSRKRSADELVADEEAEGSDEVMVTINGVQKPLSQVTDEDKSSMTSDEYAQYYEAYMSSL